MTREELNQALQPILERLTELEALSAQLSRIEQKLDRLLGTPLLAGQDENE